MLSPDASKLLISCLLYLYHLLLKRLKEFGSEQIREALIELLSFASLFNGHFELTLSLLLLLSEHGYFRR